MRGSATFLLLFLLAGAAPAQVNLGLGLMAYYPFSGNANDQSGNANHPVFNNAVLTADRFGNAGNAFQFNGTGSYMKIANHPTINMGNTMSISLWVKPMGYYTGPCHNNMLVMKGDADYLTGNYTLRFSPDPLSGCVSNPPFAQSVFYGGGTIATSPFVQLNRWYSVICTSDGITDKIYVDCVLKNSAPAAASTFTNSFDLFFGKMNNATYPYWLNGDLDEIRIYKRALTPDEVNVLGGCSAAGAGTPIGGIINTYTPVLGLTPCTNGIVVEDGSTFNTGDTVLLIQMKGAVIDSTNTASFGTITDYKNAGNYEMNYVKSRTGNTIELKNTLTRQYDIPDGRVQLIRVPYFQNANITSTLTCLPWDGSKGGVLVLNTLDTADLNASIDVSGKGLRGGLDPVTIPSSFFCNESQFYYPPNPDLASEKGEGIAVISAAKSFGKGASANGGGGGNSHNSGGGGGSNAGVGGLGGYNFEGSPCTNVPYDNRGYGGKALAYTAAANKIFAGGGGGAGQSNNPQGFQSRGGNGGGIVLILSGKIRSNGNKIIANGDPGYYCGSGSAACHEGMGGGGGGGTVLIKTGTYIDNLLVENKGGKGADMTAGGFLRVGPGGGGGGGLAWFSSPSLPGAVSVAANGGLNGVCIAYADDAYGSASGQSGTVLFNLVVPVDIVPFKPNIDSVRISKNQVQCDSFAFSGLGYTNTSAITGWQWYFGDGGTASTQHTGHTYAPGSYVVKLVVTDINGCKDSIETSVSASTLTADAGPDNTICAAGTVVLQASSSGATQYTWVPAAYLNDATLLNPVATPPATTMFYLTASNASGCPRKDSVLVTVRAANSFFISPPASACLNKSFQLFASGGDIYSWQPAGSLNDPAIFNPIASPAATTTFSVSITDTLCGNTANLFTTLTVLPLPSVRAAHTNDITCIQPSSQLGASGARQYQWAPSGTLNNPGVSGPVATPVTTTMYVVTGTDAAGCVNTDSVLVKVNYAEKGGYFMPTGFTPNHDGLNDCYGVKLWGAITEIEFSIYNRWGQRVFCTTQPGDCWNGMFKGVMQTPDVYVYMIRAKTVCEPFVFRKGTFVLIR